MREEVEAAAAWWADVLRGPPIKDNGDEMQSVMGTLAGALHGPPAEEQIAAFERELRAVAETMAERLRSYEREHRGEDHFLLVIDTDYGPGGVLLRALVASDQMGRLAPLLPWKTTMTVTPGKVSVSKGYGAPEQTIYPTTERG